MINLEKIFEAVLKEYAASPQTMAAPMQYYDSNAMCNNFANNMFDTSNQISNKNMQNGLNELDMWCDHSRDNAAKSNANNIQMKQAWNQALPQNQQQSKGGQAQDNQQFSQLSNEIKSLRKDLKDIKKLMSQKVSA